MPHKLLRQRRAVASKESGTSKDTTLEEEVPELEVPKPPVVIEAEDSVGLEDHAG